MSQQIYSPAHFSRLPLEVFPSVTSFLSSRDLASVLLVSKDARHCAAPEYFKSLRINLDIPQSNFVLACCIKSSKTQYARSCVQQLRLVTLNTGRPSTAIMDMPAAMYSRAVEGIVGALPNLRNLDLDIPQFLPHSLLPSSFTSPMRHLRLGAVAFSEDEPMQLSTTMHLETLSLGISSDHGDSFETLGRVLDHVAPTLQCLELRGDDSNNRPPTVKDVQIGDWRRLDKDLQFPQLRVLSCDSISRGSNILDVLLRSTTRVHTLSISSSCDGTRDFLRTKGHIRSLEKLCLLGNAALIEEVDDVIRFLQDNTNLDTLHICTSLPTAFISSQLLPLLNESFCFLTDLRLACSEPSIADESLKAISSIQNLRYLSLSAGSQTSPRSTWKIDIQTILLHLAPLRYLNLLAFSKDTHEITIHHLSPVRFDYYATKGLPINVDLAQLLTADEYQRFKEADHLPFDEALERQAEYRCTAWERWHAERMLTFAHRLTEVFGMLQWCFIGQLAFRVQRENYERRRVATMDCSARSQRFTHSLRTSFSVWPPA